MTGLTAFLIGLMRLNRPIDTPLDAINRQIAHNRAKHLPVADLLAARTTLLHSQLAAVVASGGSA